MSSLDLSVDLDIAAENAWAVLADFPGFLKWAAGRQGSIEIEGEGVGMIRHMDLPGTGKMAERLDRLDPETMTIGYTLVYGNPAGMAKYQAVVNVNGTAEDTCRIDWHGEFTAAAGGDENTVSGNLEAAYHGMSAALVEYVKQG